MKTSYQKPNLKPLLTKFFLFLIPTILIFSCSKNEGERIAPKPVESSKNAIFNRIADKIRNLRNSPSSTARISGIECVDTASFNQELRNHLQQELQISKEDELGIRTEINKEVEGKTWGTQDDNGTITITDASARVNYYANKYVSEIGVEAESFTKTNEDAENLAEFTNNLSNRFSQIAEEIEADPYLTETEKEGLKTANKAISIILPAISDYCTSISYCAGPSENERIAGLGKFLKKAVNLVATVVTSVVVNTFYYGIAGATVGAGLGGAHGAVIGATWGGALGAVLGTGQGIINGVTCNCVWKSLPCFGCK